MTEYIKICEYCGEEFVTKSKQKRFCDRQHYATCCICGNSINVPSNNVSYYFTNRQNVTCSTKCRYELGLRTSGMTGRDRWNLARQSMIKKYGVENPGQLASVIEKREQTNLAKYGARHPTQSKEVQEKTKQTCQAKYGVDHVTQSDQFKEKSRQTCQERYGVDFYTQTDEIQTKIVSASLARFGTERPTQSDEVKAKVRQTNQSRYGADHIMQTEEGIRRMKAGIAARHDGDSNFNNLEKTIRTNQQRYGHNWYTQTDEYRQKIRETSLQKYGVDHWLQLSDIIQKREITCRQKYGASNIFSSEVGKSKCRSTLLAKYGVINPSQYEEFRRKATRNARNSKLEDKICSLFANYDIDYIHHYHITDEDTKLCHEFDFYLPKYKLLLDADGVYFHSYLSDPDGERSIDYYDDIRISLVPADHMFHVIIEGNEDAQVKEIIKILESIDSNIFNYESYLFNWCRSIEFPFPDYTEKRIVSDWNSLCKYENRVYNMRCRIGESIIKQYHKSIFSCHVGKHLSPIESWYDDDKLKQVIKNRLIYVNNVDPSKILRGFNVSKICPVVSMFNPILAKYLVRKYLDEFNTIFDPFSGFSGRMLGAAAASKKYIGQDLNPLAVNESNQIIEFLHLENRCSVVNQDVQASTGEYDCLLTCPPYNKKEFYNQETVFQSCDAWIDECLRRFKCKRYVFVVDETKRYTSCIVETLKSTSHFADVQEKVIVIDKS